MLSAASTAVSNFSASLLDSLGSSKTTENNDKTKDIQRPQSPQGTGLTLQHQGGHSMTVADKQNGNSADRPAESDKAGINRNKEQPRKGSDSSIIASQRTNSSGQGGPASAAAAPVSQSDASSAFRNDRQQLSGSNTDPTGERLTVDESTSVNGNYTVSKDRSGSGRRQETTTVGESGANNDDGNSKANDRNANGRSLTADTVTKPVKARTKAKRRRNASGISIEYPQTGRSIDANTPGPANPKRNQDFHALFRTVPIDDFLIDDYGCALQKEILMQGRLYLSMYHVCFNANIFGWVTNFVIPFHDIVSIEKKMTAFVIPNAILILTSSAKYFFASFLSRDTAYELLVKMWRESQPSFAVTPSYTESEFPVSRKSSESSASSDEVDTDDTDDQGMEPTTNEAKDKQKQSGRRFALPKISLDSIKARRNEQGQDQQPDLQENGNSVHSDPPSPKFADNSLSNDKKSRRRSRSEAAMTQTADVHALYDSTKSDCEPERAIKRPHARKLSKINTTAKKRRHATTCGCLRNGQHYNHIALDAKFSGSVEKIYNLLFTSGFVKQFLIEHSKCTDVNIEEWTNEFDGTLSRASSYVKPLSGPFGPKSTKCYLKDECIYRDFDDHVTTDTTTTTPDVPSGGSFRTKTKTCIMWAGQNETRVIVTTAVEFMKSNWLKGAIEKAAVEGQKEYQKNLAHAIRKYIACHPSEFQDDPRTPVREMLESSSSEEHSNNDKSMSVEKDRSSGHPLQRQSDNQEDNRPESSSLASVVGQALSSFLSITGPIFQSLAKPSIHTLMLLAFLSMVTVDMYIWLQLQSVSNKLDSSTHNMWKKYSGRHAAPRYNMPPHHYGPISSSYDSQLAAETELLWEWISHKLHQFEKSKTTPHNINQQPKFDAEQKVDTQETQPSSQTSEHEEVQEANYGDDDANVPRGSYHFPPSYDLYLQIEDLHRLLRAAEGCAQRILDLAELERAHHNHKILDHLKKFSPIVDKQKQRSSSVEENNAHVAGGQESAQDATEQADMNKMENVLKK